MARFDGDPLDWPAARWPQFREQFAASWRQGEHKIAIGETGSGKTRLLAALLTDPAIERQHEHIVVFVTKTFDESFSRKVWPGYTVMRNWNARKAAQAKRVLLWPTPGTTIKETVANQQRVFEKALNEIFRERGWTMLIDELQWVVDQLGFGLEMKTYQHQARSSGITVVSGFQRPSHVPVVTYGAADGAFIFRQSEDADVKRLAAVGGLDADKLRAALPLLPKHDLLYISRAATTGVIRTRVEL